jgi:hypothetical protein
MDLKYYNHIKGEYGNTEDRYVLKPEYRYDSTFKNPTPINADISEWERIENTLKTTLKNGPYDIPASDYGYGEPIHDVFNKRYADRVSKQQQLAAGTMDQAKLQEIIEKNKFIDPKTRNIARQLYASGIISDDQDEAVNKLIEIKNSRTKYGGKSSKYKKSRKSKKSNKSNKSKKSTKSNKSRKSKK